MPVLTRVRVRALERRAGLAGECDGLTTVVLNVGEPVATDAPRCPGCGEVHVLRVEELVVGADDEAGQEGGIPQC
jgi:hypothetical protein